MPTRNQPRNINLPQDNRRINSEDKLVNYIRSMLGEPQISVEVTDEQIKLIIDSTIRKFSDWAYGGEQTIIFELEARSDIQDYRLDERVQAIKSVSFGSSLGSIATSSSGGYVYPFGTLGVNYIPHITLQGEVSSLGAGGAMSSTSGGTAGGVAGGPNSGNSGLGSMVDAYVTRSQVDTMNALNARGVNFEFNSNTKILRIFENFNGSFLVEGAVEYVPNPEYDEIYAHPWVKEYALEKTRYLWGSITGKYDRALVGGAQINYADMKSEAQEKIQQLDEDLLDKYSEALGIFAG
jgi:hypothetical protein